MDDVDDVPVVFTTEDHVASLSTEQLREEVARLQSLLIGNDVEDDENDEIEDSDDGSTEHHSFGCVAETTLNYTNGDVYKGDAIGGMRHGMGTHQCSTGDFYEGGWNDDMRHGKGEMTYISGLRYKGDWVEDKARGYGECHYANGNKAWRTYLQRAQKVFTLKLELRNSAIEENIVCKSIHITTTLLACQSRPSTKYTGAWKDDHRWGWGTITFANGDVYEGEWIDDVIEGSGRYSYADKSYFQGKFLNGKRVKGKFCSADGTIEYEGQWKDNMRHGSGTFHLSGVYKYNGNWVDDARQGQGKCVYADGSVYDGHWNEDERDGHGKFESKDEVYEGNWRKNTKDGYGTLKDAAGGRYQGQWKMGFEEGNGKRLYPDGSTYEGQWFEGKRHGKGSHMMMSKEVYKGEWRNDMRHGYGICTYPDGSRYRGEWDENCWLQSTADPAFTKVFGLGLSRGIAGEVTMFGIEARDELNNKRLSGGDKFCVRVQNEENGDVIFADVSDNSDGSYIIKFMTKIAGTYSCSVMTSANEHVAESPYPVRVLSGRPYPRMCEVSGEGHRSAVMNNLANFYVEAFDRYGNALHGKICECLPLEVSISSNNIEIDNIQIVDTGHGRYEISYTPSKKGLYRVEVKSRGIQIRDSPYSLQVHDTESFDRKILGEEFFDFAHPLSDKTTQWGKIALTEYMFDGDQGGWDSEDRDIHRRGEDLETPEEKCMRENPGVPVITNLEDLYKIPRLQKVQREEQRKYKATKLKELRRCLEAEEVACVALQQELRGDESSPSASIVDLD